MELHLLLEADQVIRKIYDKRYSPARRARKFYWRQDTRSIEDQMKTYDRTLRHYAQEIPKVNFSASKKIEDLATTQSRVEHALDFVDLQSAIILRGINDFRLRKLPTLDEFRDLLKDYAVFQQYVSLTPDWVEADRREFVRGVERVSGLAIENYRRLVDAGRPDLQEGDIVVYNGYRMAENHGDNFFYVHNPSPGFSSAELIKIAPSEFKPTLLKKTLLALIAHVEPIDVNKDDPGQPILPPQSMTLLKPWTISRQDYYHTGCSKQR